MPDRNRHTALALGAAAYGAVAVGAAAIGSLAINRLVLRRGRISELRIGRLIVDEMEIKQHTEIASETTPGMRLRDERLMSNLPAGRGLPPDLLAAITKAYEAGQIRHGASRIVVIVADKAFKFARGSYGRECNLFEKNTWDACQEVQHRRYRLCPVIEVSADGAMLVMASAAPLLPGEDPKQLDDWWDHRPPGQCCPAEHKPEDWGWFEGRMVCVDYAASVLDPAVGLPNTTASPELTTKASLRPKLGSSHG